MTIYNSANEAIFPLVPPEAKTLLDIGCGGGNFGQQLKQRQPIKVTGITYSSAEAEQARKVLDHVIVSDLNSLECATLPNFDCIVCSHVLEHLYFPENLVRQLSKQLSANGILIVILPNVLNWRQRLKFLLGNFDYTESGILDRTHFRFYTWKTAQKLVTDNQFRLIVKEAQGSFPLTRFLFGVGRFVDKIALILFPGLFATQFVFLAEKADT